MTHERVPSIETMAFWHRNGLIPTFLQAQRFAGKEGRIATLPDIVSALISAEDEFAWIWRNWFTTLSAEYYGHTRGGTPVLIVAHGIGPMSTLDGIKNTYAYQYKDRSRSRNGGRISQDEFLKLEGGFYGPVAIVDFKEMLRRRKLMLHGQILSVEDALHEPLAYARFGHENVHALLKMHREIATRHHERQGDFRDVKRRIEDGDPSTQERLMHLNDPFILTLEGTTRTPYEFIDLDDGHAIAHLLSIGGLKNMGHSQSRYSALCRDVACHDWTDASRFVGVRDLEPITEIHPGVNDFSDLRDRHWQRLMAPNPDTDQTDGFFHIMPVDTDNEVWFSMVPHSGHGGASFDPEFLITSQQSLGDPVLFESEVTGYHGFFGFDGRSVQRQAPQGANAFRFVSGFDMVGEPGERVHQIMVQYHRVGVDDSRRLMPARNLQNDQGLFLELLELDMAAQTEVEAEAAESDSSEA
jgi:hypothetical protein